MKRGFRTEKVGRFRRSAARGMARRGIPAWVIAAVLRLKRSTAEAVVACKDTPAAIWSRAELALFREGK